MHASDKAHRKGTQKTAGETLDQYRQALTEDVTKMQERVKEMTGYTPTTFTYPFGAVSKEALPILKDLGFQGTLVCESRVNYITMDRNACMDWGGICGPAGRILKNTSPKPLSCRDSISL